MATPIENPTRSLSADENARLDDLLRYSRLLYARGLICATGGNTSARVGETVWITRTGAVLGELEKEDLVPVRLDGAVLADNHPSKELGMHLALYNSRPEVTAVIHVHPTQSIAYSARQEPSEDSMVPYTAAFYMRAGRVPMVGYFPSGSHDLHAAIAVLAPRYHAILLKNHGIIVGAADACAGMGIVEEMEQNAQLGLILGSEAASLTSAECAAIDLRLGRAWE
jgi:ribulose-5-phosphate 4-epimerase/fuculose-1-phosphate aldolase